jgi:hypothetical protein
MRHATDKDLLQERMKLIEKTRQARRRCEDLKADAERLGLTVLAEKWNYVGQILEKGIDEQVRALRAPALPGIQP